MIEPGSRVGPYEIVSLLGEGGMGRVFRARDVRLRRDVALKLLEVSKATGNRSERFGREARAASALNHPHIAAIYDIGETDTVAYIGMELVEGESLSQRLARGKLRLDEALLLAVQIADGLAAAHAKGIVHRDLKPGNIMLGSDGRAKIVDFGLAKFEGPDRDDGQPSDDPTQSFVSPLTAQGLVLGTAAYMSPEQARGAPVDYRSDLFSFGSLLYEMISGQRPFARPSEAETLVAILTENPLPLGPPVPEALRWAIERCQQKEPGDRYESTRDLARDLEAVATRRSRPVESPVSCRRCQARNPQNQRFCGHCGAELAIRCSSCDAPVVGGNVFCGSCGTRLTEGAAETPRASTQAPASASGTGSSVMAGERRQATILVSRLSRYESLAEQALPHEIQGWLARLAETAKEVVNGFGGVIDRVEEEEIVAVFGVPVSHGDDALRAARAALELHARVRAGPGGSPPEDALEVSSAIHTGQVVSQAPAEGRAAPRIVGEAVSVALGLARAAAAGQVLLTPASHRVAGSHLRTEALEPLRIRSSGDPLVPYRVLGVDDSAGLTADSAELPLTPFAGRESELSSLIEGVDAAARGEGQFAVVIGDAGAGKSRLLYELRQHLQDREVTLLEGRCHSQGAGVAYLPCIQACRCLLGLSNDATLREQHDQTVAAVLEIDGQLEALLPIYLHLLSIPSERYLLPEGLDGRQLHHATSEALAALFTLAANRRPLVLLFEDWHWVDDASHGVVRQLEEMCREYPLLVAVSYRPEPTQQWGSPTRHRAVHLGALEEAPATRIVQSVLGAERIPEGLGTLLHERTGGNPFFLEEVCRTLHEEGAVRVENGEVVVSGTLEGLQLPDTVQAVIRTRLDRIEPAARDVLRCASVIGRDFSASVLSRVVDVADDLNATLELLKRRGLIRQTRVVPEPMYRFQHALTQEVAYESLLKRQLETLHGRVARAIEEVYPSRLDEYDDQLARHFAIAESWLEAVDYGRRVIARLLDLSRFPEAVEPLERAQGWLARIDADDASRERKIGLLLDEERLRDSLGERQRQAEVVAELLDILGTGGDRPELIEAYTRQADLLSRAGDFTAGEGVLESALAVSRRLQDSRSERDTLRSLAFLLWHEKRNEEALEALDQALAIDRDCGDLTRVAGDLTNRGSVLRGLGRYDDALASLDEALSAYAEGAGGSDDWMRSAEVHYIIHGVYRDMGKPKEGEPHLDRAFELTRDRSFFHQSFQVQALANRYLERGDVEEGIELLRRTVESGRKTRYAFGLAQCQQSLADRLIALDRQDEALPYLLEATQVFSRVQDDPAELRALTSAAPILAAAGRPDEARGAWQRVLEIARRNEWISSALEAHGGLAGLAEADRQLELARSHLREALELSQRVEGCPQRGDLLNRLGILHWKSGSHDVALSYYAEALAFFEARGEQAHVGVILNSLGATLRSLGRHAEAIERLKEAIASHRATGQELLLGHALSVMGDLSLDGGDPEGALTNYEESLTLRRHLGDRRGEGWMLHHCARALAASGKEAAALESAARAAAIAAESGDAELAEGCTQLLSQGTRS